MLAPGFQMRPERAADHRAVEELTRDAFWDLYVPGCDEHFLAHRLRDHGDFVPALSLVVEGEGKVLGSIMTTRSRLVSENSELPSLTFGPISVHKAYRRRGIATALIAEVAKRARELGAPALVILGDPHHYVSAGFRNGRDVGVSAEDGSHPLGLLVRELSPGALAGAQWKVYFSSVFAPAPGLEAFDATFPQRASSWQPSQEVFSMLSRARLP